MADGNLIFYLLIFAVTFTLTGISVKKLIPILKRNAAQPIYEEGPAWHLKKQGTPTMGGIGFVFASVVSLSAAAAYLTFINEHYFARSLLLTLSFTLANALIGLIDDYAKIRKKFVSCKRI